MKRSILFLVIVAYAISGCKKAGLAKYEIEKSYEDPSVKLEDFKKAIAAGTDGFRMIITSSEGGLVGGYIRFDAITGAKFLLDNTVANATTPINNAYSIKVSQANSVLGLGSTSAFAVIAKSITGVDTTYSYKSTVGDTLKLVGNLLGTKLSLIKLAKKDGDEYLAGKMGQTIVAVNNLKSFVKYFKRLTTGGKSYDVIFNTATRTVTFNYLTGTSFSTSSMPCVFTNNGVEFPNPFIDGTNIIKSFNDLVINATTSSATLTIASAAATLTNEMAPVTYDTTLPAIFYNTRPPNGAYWISVAGFTINGLADGYGVSTIPKFDFIFFYPRYRPTLTRLGYMIDGSSGSYGPALVASFPANGTIKFTNGGSYGTTPTAIQTIVTNTTDKFVDVGGFYVIKTSATTYDLVSVTDAGAWISLQPE